MKPQRQVSTRVIHRFEGDLKEKGLKHVMLPQDHEPFKVLKET